MRTPEEFYDEFLTHLANNATELFSAATSQVLDERKVKCRASAITLLAAWRDECVEEKITGDDWAMALLKTRAEAAEAERDDLRDRVEGMTQTMREMLDHMNKDEAERDRLKFDLRMECENREGYLETIAILREENEALREEVQSYEFSTAAIAGMLHQNQLDEAWEWANDATSKARLAASSKLALLRTKGDTK